MRARAPQSKRYAFFLYFQHPFFKKKQHCTVHTYGFHILRNIQNLAKQQRLQGPLVFVSCQSLPSGFHSQGREHLGLAQGRASTSFWNVIGTWPPPLTLGARPQGRQEHVAVQGKGREKCTCAKHRPVKPQGHGVAAMTPKRSSGGKVGRRASTKETNSMSKTRQYKVTVGKDQPNFHHAKKADPTNDQSALTNRGIKH